jgi:hypothetical protein
LNLQKNCVGQEGALQEAWGTADGWHNYPNEVASDNDLKILDQNWLPENQLLASYVLLTVPTIKLGIVISKKVLIVMVNITLEYIKQYII